MRRLAALTVPLVLCAGLVVADSGPNHQVRTSDYGSSGSNINDITHAFCCGGTLGSLVSRNGVQYILSNNHVLARVDQAAPGEDISQPGLIDNGCRVATIVADFSQAIPLGTQNVDAAIAALRTGTMNSTGSILDLGVPCSNPSAPAVGMAVAKSGRTTGCTNGSITSINTNVSVRYQKNCGSGRKFTIPYTNQVVVTGTSTAFSAGGDSGSLIVDGACGSGTHHPLALLFAGSSTITVGNPIADVTGALGVSFVGTNCQPAIAWSSAAAAGGPLQNDIDFATMIKDRHAPDLMADPDVLGVGVGTLAEDAGRVALVIYLNSARPIRPRVPDAIEGVPVKIVRTDPFVAF